MLLESAAELHFCPSSLGCCNLNSKCHYVQIFDFTLRFLIEMTISFVFLVGGPNLQYKTPAGPNLV